MEALFDFLKDNPLYTAVGAALFLFFIISLLKKGVTLAIIALLLNAGYGYYVNDLAQDYYKQAEKKVEEARKHYEAVQEEMDKAGEAVDKAGDLFDKAGKLMDD